MPEIRRSRTRAAPPEPVRAVRRTPTHLLDPDKTPRAATMTDLPSSGEIVSFKLRIELEVLEGDVSPADFQRWVQEALNKYHTFRHGYMDPCLNGQAKCPSVTLCE